MMKSLVMWLLWAAPFAALSQGVFSNSANITLQQVIQDYPSRFKNISGELLSNNPQSTDYVSKVKVEGSENAVVTRYSPVDGKEAYGWKCLLMVSEDFSAVSGKYQELHAQIRNSIIKIDGQKPFILNGNYESPTTEKRFVTSDFYLLPSSGEMKNLKIELTMEYYVTEWKVALQVYENDAFDEEYQVNTF